MNMTDMEFAQILLTCGVTLVVGIALDAVVDIFFGKWRRK